MIISASRRTDIPAFYSEWFLNRLKEGYVYVRNPMNTKQISKISLDIKDVDFIVFWTKNPVDIIDKLDEIDNMGFNYYFQFTLNSYNTTLEPNVPPKKQIIDTFKRLSDKIGVEKVIWRYDPIFYTDLFDFDYHCKWFEYLADTLNGYTCKCVIGFLDLYKKTITNLKNTHYHELIEEEIVELVLKMQSILFNNRISVETCALNMNLSQYNVNATSCIDMKLIEKITGKPLYVNKDKTQRAECGCIESRDIGTYNTCNNLCKYCYANFSSNQVAKNILSHSPKSPLLFGEVDKDDKVVESKSKSVFSGDCVNNWENYL